MLIVVVVVFAVLWLPYRAISLYNAIAVRPVYNMWLMLFAKTCIFLNSSINPILYNAMSTRFRQATVNTLSCRSSSKLIIHWQLFQNISFKVVSAFMLHRSP